MSARPGLCIDGPKRGEAVSVTGDRFVAVDHERHAGSRTAGFFRGSPPAESALPTVTYQLRTVDVIGGRRYRIWTCKPDFKPWRDQQLTYTALYDADPDVATSCQIASEPATQTA